MQILDEKIRYKVNGLDILRFCAQMTPVYPLYSDRDNQIMELLGVPRHKQTLVLFSLELVDNAYFVPANPIADRKVIYQYESLHHLVDEIDKVDARDSELFYIESTAAGLASISVALAGLAGSCNNKTSTSFEEVEESAIGDVNTDAIVKTRVVESGWENIACIADLATETARKAGLQELSEAIRNAKSALCSADYQRQTIKEARRENSLKVLFESPMEVEE